jgi:predicted RNA-binding protein
MCQLTAYMARSGQEELVQEDVGRVEVEGEKVFLTSIFGEREAINAKIREVDLVQNRLVLVPSSPDGNTEDSTEEMKK